MRRVNSRELLKARSQLFEKYLGQSGDYHNGEVPFLGKKLSCSLAYTSRQSIMSSNHLLSLRGELRLNSDPDSTRHPGRCFLNRLGGWSIRGRDPLLIALAQRLKQDKAFRQVLAATDIDSLEIRRTESRLLFSINLYGGGYSATVLPPLQFPVGLAAAQAEQSAILLNGLIKISRNLIDDDCHTGSRKVS